MPVGNAPVRTPRRDRAIAGMRESWSIPVARLGGTRVRVSYNVFIGVLITASLVAVASTRGGNSDLPMAAATGALIWMAGWIVQAITHVTIARAGGVRVTNLNIGILGVEASPNRWTAVLTLCVCLATVGSLLLLAMALRWIEGGFEVPTMQRTSEMWTIPSIGFSPEDSIWRTASWLCCFQAFFQMFPLPRSMGRQLIGALTYLCGSRLDLTMQTLVFRRILSAIALLTLIVSILVMTGENSAMAARWPLLLLLALLLWASTRSSDVAELLAAMRSASEDPRLAEAGGHVSTSTGMLTAVREAMESRQATRRLREVARQEHNEALQVDRLDDILNRVHEEGIDSLNDQEREILQRVSENLRRQREQDGD